MWNVTLCICHSISRSLGARKKPDVEEMFLLIQSQERTDLSWGWKLGRYLCFGSFGLKFWQTLQERNYSQQASAVCLLMDFLHLFLVVMCECVGILTALTLDSSLQVLSSPFCSTSFCWTRLCTAAALEPLCSLSSWLADSRAVSSVCCHTTRT